VVLAALAALCATGWMLRPATAADPTLVLRATPVETTVRLGQDVAVEVVVENRSDDPMEVPALRMAGDALTIVVQGAGVRMSRVTRLFGEFKQEGGEIRFVPRATRPIVVPPGGRRSATLVFPAVALGKLELVTRLACDPPLESEAVSVEVVPPAGSRRLLARVETTRGDFTIELDGGAAYNSVAQIWHLARGGFYADLPFHRVVPELLVQTGDPRGDGTGYPGWYLPAEPSAEPFTRGAVGLSRGAHEDSAGSQWFAVVAEDAGDALSEGFAPLGHVVEGLDVLDALASVELSPGTTSPRKPDRVKRVRVAVR
jgi:cyclophilin family peptidyl-prolyl cis-trans isomerase